jgi:hypothetical protein
MTCSKTCAWSGTSRGWPNSPWATATPSPTSRRSATTICSPGLLDRLRLAGTSDIGTLPRLDTLALDLALPWDTLADLPLEAPLTSLYIGWASYETCGVRNIARWAGLKHLALPAVGLRHEDHTELAQLPALESLNLAGENIASLRGRPPLPGISHLAITDATHTDDLTPLRECFPDLTRLSLFINPGHAPTLKLAPLRTLKNLVVQVSNAGSVLDAASFPEGRAIITPRP